MYFVPASLWYMKSPLVHFQGLSNRAIFKNASLSGKGYGVCPWTPVQLQLWLHSIVNPSSADRQHPICPKYLWCWCNQHNPPYRHTGWRHGEDVDSRKRKQHTLYSKTSPDGGYSQKLLQNAMLKLAFRHWNAGKSQFLLSVQFPAAEQWLSG